VVVLRTNVPYRAGTSVALWTSTGARTEPGRAPQMTTSEAWLSDGMLGDLVVTPQSRKDEPLALVVVMGLQRDPSTCTERDAKGCIVARRKLAFVPKHTVRIPVVMHLACEGVSCDENSTCNYLGACIPAEVDPNTCSSPDGCVLAGDETVTEVSRGDASVPPTDAGADTPVAPLDAGGPCLNAPPEKWTTIASPPMQGRDQTASYWTGNDFLLYGGIQWGMGNKPADAGSLTEAGTGCGLFGTSGQASGGCNDGARYDPATGTWSVLSGAGTPSAHRWDPAVAFGRQHLFLIAGHAAGDTGGVFNAANNSWKPTSTAGAPGQRAYHVASHAAVLGEPTFVVWGGLAGPARTPTTSGAYYNVVTDVWTPMSEVGLSHPGGAYFATASSDDRLFVWGGTTDPNPWEPVNPNVTNAGSIFSYGLNSWVPMSTNDAPEPRLQARGVWTGSKFVVWGGWGANANLTYNSGGIYDPSKETWIRMSTENAPPGGMPTIMVWTGKRVLVWGIYQGGTGTGIATGALFDPESNKWEPVSQVGAPPFGRTSGPSDGLWNGQELLVWLWPGGSNLAQPKAALYRPPCFS